MYFFIFYKLNIECICFDNSDWGDALFSSQTEAINSVTTFGSLDNIEEDEKDPRSNILREFGLPIDSSIDTVFEKDSEVSESVLKVTPSTFACGSDENMLMVDALNFPRGKYITLEAKILNKYNNCLS